MATGSVPTWSTTAATNATADPAVNFAEGMAPSAVNDSARALMASVAKWRNDLYGITTGGSSTAYTVTTGATFASAADMSGAIFMILPHTTSGASPTLAVDGLTARAINISTGVAVPTGYLISGTPYWVKYVHATTEFIVIGKSSVLPGATVTGTNLTLSGTLGVTGAFTGTTATFSGVVTHNATSHELLVRGTTAQRSGTTAGQFRYNSDLTNIEFYDGSAWKQPQTAPPVAAGFKNLSIKVATNTTVTVAADYVTTTDGTLYQTTAVSSTINLGTTGADALDTGTIATATWYAIWVIAKADGTTKCVASTSATAPTMPTGYTYKARIGWVRTASGAAQLLGTWQLGRRTQYVVGLAQTTTSIVISSSSTGSVSVPTWTAVSISSFVPSTASIIYLTVYNGNTTSSIVAPNNSYGSYQSGSNQPFSGSPNGSGAGSGSYSNTYNVDFMLESTNIYYASNSTSNYLLCRGWEDNI